MSSPHFSLFKTCASIEACSHMLSHGDKKTLLSHGHFVVSIFGIWTFEIVSQCVMVIIKKTCLFVCFLLSVLKKFIYEMLYERERKILV